MLDRLQLYLVFTQVSNGEVKLKEEGAFNGKL